MCIVFVTIHCAGKHLFYINGGVNMTREDLDSRKRMIMEFLASKISAKSLKN